MSRKMDVDWSDWKGKAVEPEHPLSKAVPVGVTGAESVKEALTKGVLPVMLDAPKQPTKQEFEAAIAARLPSEEQIAKANDAWENRFKTHFNEFSKPIDHLNKSSVSNKKWADGKSFNSLLKDQLSEEEMSLRNSDTTDI